MSRRVHGQRCATLAPVRRDLQTVLILLLLAALAAVGAAWLLVRVVG